MCFSELINFPDTINLLISVIFRVIKRRREKFNTVHHTKIIFGYKEIQSNDKQLEKRNNFSAKIDDE